MNIPPKYEDVVAQLGAERELHKLATETLGQFADENQKLHANLAALREELGESVCEQAEALYVSFEFEESLKTICQPIIEDSRRTLIIKDRLDILAGHIGENGDEGYSTVMGAIHELSRLTKFNSELQQRLTAAEQRNKELGSFFARTPEVVFEGCHFQGFNTDGSDPVEMENGVVTRIRMVGWYCEGPKQKDTGSKGLSTYVSPALVHKREIKIDIPHPVMPSHPRELGLPSTAYCVVKAPDYWPCRDAEELERFEAWKIEDDKAVGEKP